MSHELWRLPADWRWEEFASVARVASDLVDPASYLSLPHIAPNHIEARTGRLLPYRTIGDDGVTSSKHRFRPGQVLYSKIRPYLAKVVVAEFVGLCSADMYPISTELDPRFLKWWMLTPEFTRLASEEQARTILPKINKHALGQMPVPVPPMEVQRHIVAILDDHLSSLDATDAELRLSLDRANSLKWGMLAQDLGRLGGDPVRIGELATSVKNGISVSRPKSDPNGVPILRIGAVRPLALNLSDLRYSELTLDQVGQLGGLLSAGDVLFTRYNGNPRFVGACAVVTDRVLPLTYPDKLIRVRVDAERVLPEFLAAACAVGTSRQEIQSLVKTTSGQAGISGHDLRSVKVTLPTIQTQRALLARFHEVEGSVSMLARALEDIQRRSSTLRTSLLASAFSGRLPGRAASA